ncbi:MAG: class I SAM-dependent methyltransferase [Planctomycetes bacterium]|nr:class I SAM-dependent methyltransferase [Planctomycetota bacterium]
MSLWQKLTGREPKDPTRYPDSGAKHTLLLGGAGPNADIVRASRKHVVVADLRRAPGVTLLANLEDPFPFKDATFDEVFSLEFLEHIPHPDLPRVLKECRRVLAKGGRWLSGCPDMEVLASWFGLQCECVDGWQADPKCAKCGGRARISPSRWLKSVFGNQEDYGDARRGDTHKNGLWFGRVKELLEEAGFAEVKRVDAGVYYARFKADTKVVVEANRG